MKKLIFLAALVCLSWCALEAQSLTTALEGGAPSQSNSLPAADVLGRTTPSGTVVGFLQATQSGNYAAGADYLQMSAGRRQSQGAEIAEKLKRLMDRSFAGSLRKLSTQPQGDLDAGTPDMQNIGVFTSGDGDVPVTLVRVNDPSAGRVWLFSAETLSKVPDLYDNLQAHQVETRLPQWLVRNQFLAMPLWQWLALVAAVPVSFGIGWALVLLLAIPRRLWLKFRNRPNLHGYRDLSRALLVTFSALAHRVIAAYLGFPLLPRFYYYRTIGVLISASFFWFLLRVTALTMQRLRLHAVSAGRTGTGTLMLLGERLIKALVVIVAVLVTLGILGFNLTTVLAGLGIGGIAIAFAAQKTLENVFGGVSLLADEVIRVGDFCTIGNKQGTVEDISLRSTRIRTLDRTVLSIPNGSLATMNIENFASRDKVLLNPTFGVSSGTTADQLRYILAEVRGMLYAHAKVEQSTARIRLAGVDSVGINLELYCYVLTSNWAEFTAIREDLLLRIMEIVKKSGGAFAAPSTTVYVVRDGGLDQEKTAAAEEQVGHWREQNVMPFPDHAPADKEGLRGAITYPAKESATAPRPDPSGDQRS